MLTDTKKKEIEELVLSGSFCISEIKESLSPEELEYYYKIALLY